MAISSASGPWPASPRRALVDAVGGRKFELTKNQIRLAQSAMANRDTHVAQLCQELDISRATLYRYVGPDGALRGHALKALES